LQFKARNHISKNPFQKRSGGMAQGVGPEFKLQYHKTNKKQNKQTHACGRAQCPIIPATREAKAGEAHVHLAM
jgi:hypothetical protein